MNRGIPVTAVLIIVTRSVREKPASTHTITRHTFHHQTIAVYVD